MHVPLGEGTIDVDLPDCEVTVAEPPGGETVDVPEATRRALAAPFGPPLAARAAAGDEVAIVVTDVTRATPDDVLLDALVARLLDAGVDRADVTVVVGLGLHRPLSDDEIEREYGEHADLVVNHDPDAVVRVGAVDGCRSRSTPPSRAPTWSARPGWSSPTSTPASPAARRPSWSAPAARR